LITVQNVVTVSHTACAYIRGFKKLGDAGARPCDWGVADRLETGPSPRVTMLSLVVLGQTGGGNELTYGDPPRKISPTCPAFQGPSRSLELTRIDRLSVIFPTVDT